MMSSSASSSGYWRSLGDGLATAWVGLQATLGHLGRAGRGKAVQEVREPGYFADDGVVTLQYPHEHLSVPPLGRYKLDCEIDDCIVCDKCARVCPVDCIAIEAVKSPVEFGKASDGSGKRLYAAKFDIDLAKCCYCGLCTTVCPTECLVMTADYDYSTQTLGDFTYSFANLTVEEADRRKAEYETFHSEKAVQAAAKKAATATEGGTDGSSASPISDGEPAPALKKAFKPVIKKKPE